MKNILIILLLISSVSFGQTDSTKLANGGACIFLDFDGQTVTGTHWSGTIVASADPINGNTASMDSVVNYVAEFYQPFNVVVTRDSSLYFIASRGKRIRIIFSPDCSSYSCILGVTYYPGTMYYGDDTPSFVNSNQAINARIRGRIAAHEAGHQFGLFHQNSSGSGSGETAIRPIMNSTISASINMEVWSTGTNENGAAQSDIDIILNGTGDEGEYGIGARPGDAGNTFNTAKYLQKDQNFYAFIGVSDSDFYKIDIPSTQTVSFSVTPWSLLGSNTAAVLDAAIDLYNEDHSLIASSSNTTVLNATLSQSLTAGTYYIKVRADRGNANNPTGYGFMGHYYLSYTY